MVTIKDIARAAGVHASTVSRTLSGSPLVKDETKRLILDYCEEMGYMPNALARGLVQNRTQNLGMLVPDLSNPYYAELMSIVGNATKSIGYNMLWCNSFQDEELELKYFKLLIENQVDGIIMHPINGGKLDAYTRFVKNVPTVFIGDILPQQGIACVSTDNEKAGSLAVEHLHACGCSSVAFIGADLRKRAHNNRVRGFTSTATLLGLDASIVSLAEDYPSAMDRGYHGIRQYLKQYQRIPDGVVAVSDYGAIGVMKACQEEGIAVPTTMQLIGFDNLDFSSLPNISLTTIAPNKESLVEKTTAMLSSMIDGHGPGGHEKVVPQLIVRSTTI